MWSCFFFEIYQGDKELPSHIGIWAANQPLQRKRRRFFILWKLIFFFSEWLCGIPTKMMSPSIFRRWSVVFCCTSSMFLVRYWLVIYHPVSLNQPVILWERLLSLLTWTCFEQLQTLQRLHYAKPEKHRWRGVASKQSKIRNDFVSGALGLAQYGAVSIALCYRRLVTWPWVEDSLGCPFRV